MAPTCQRAVGKCCPPRWELRNGWLGSGRDLQMWMTLWKPWFGDLWGICDFCPFLPIVKVCFFVALKAFKQMKGKMDGRMTPVRRTIII